MSTNTNKQNSTLAYTPTEVLFRMSGEEFGTDVKGDFHLYPEDDTLSVKISMGRMHDLAEQADNDVLKTLTRDGYNASKKYEAGAGIALKVIKIDDSYEITAFIGEVAKPFDTKKIMDKKFYRVDAKTLDALFTFVLNNYRVEDIRETAAKLKRTTLDLG